MPTSRHPRPGVAAHVSGLLAVVLAATLIPAASAVAAQDATWRELLGRALEAGRELPFTGSLTVITFDEAGPVISELTVAHDGGGILAVGDPSDRVIGSGDGRAFLSDEDAGTLLQIGGVERSPFSLNRLAGKYDIEVGGTLEGPAGTATLVELYEEGLRHPRERLYLDRGSGLIVRRETFGRDGGPVRLVAFTRLDLDEDNVPEMMEQAAASSTTSRADVSGRGVHILRDVGWHVPTTLGAGFGLVDVSALGEGDDASSLHLFYSDGLYSLSVYEQHGRLDGPSLVRDGARRTNLAGAPVYRWPGAQPATYVWSGGGVTFTLVSDAPPDTIEEAARGLPHDEPPSLGRRLGRGLVRVGRWIWPFD